MAAQGPRGGRTLPRRSFTALHGDSCSVQRIAWAQRRSRSLVSPPVSVSRARLALRATPIHTRLFPHACARSLTRSRDGRLRDGPTHTQGHGLKVVARLRRAASAACAAWDALLLPPQAQARAQGRPCLPYRCVPPEDDGRAMRCGVRCDAFGLEWLSDARGARAWKLIALRWSSSRDQRASARSVCMLVFCTTVATARGRRACLMYERAACAVRAPGSASPALTEPLARSQRMWRTQTDSAMDHGPRAMDARPRTFSSRQQAALARSATQHGTRQVRAQCTQREWGATRRATRRTTPDTPCFVCSDSECVCAPGGLATCDTGASE